MASFFDIFAKKGITARLDFEGAPRSHKIQANRDTFLINNIKKKSDFIRFSYVSH